MQLHSGGLGTTTDKMADVRQVSAAVIVTIICKRRKRKRKVKEVWDRKWLKRRTERGVYRQLLEELRLEDAANYRRYLRMGTATFQWNLNGFPYFSDNWGHNFVRHFDAKKLHLPPILRINFVTRYVIFYRFRLRLSQRFKT